ncbi:MAG: glycosyltransferase family 39 protein [Nitrospira sp.]|nr:glycosyltransferase family 39 protein [Nitrospira sp.]MDH4370223.1 glycosyltransferase family 39 protein [Nitrospira sp.]MDH5346504.1 glycosyltransferase family 39 protein [Nitrospira sp.]MDH5496306.1 glycosyltransferase family 39 protein [Nitrospira sp.]MDH5723835.1 glycosyltransferase family 39 protein [Nitrospira sp.]
MDRPSPQPIQLLLLLLVAGLLFFIGLGSMGLTDRDEGRNAEAGREMFASGDLVTPTFNGELRVAKPVFVYWLMTVSYHVFGVNEFAARAPSAFFGVGLIVMHYLFLSRLRGPTVGLFGALMLLLNIEILALGRMAITDSVLIFFTTLSLYSFWLGLHEEGAGRHWTWGFYGGMALATLTKGPVGFAIPLITALLYLITTRQWLVFWRRGAPIAGTLLFLILAGPWYVAMLVIHGDAYASQAKVHTVGRFLAPMEGHGGGWWFYFPVLLLGFYPWSALLPAAFYRAYTTWRESPALLYVRNGLPGTSEPAGSGHELEWFAGLWVIGAFIFFSLSSTRLPHYIGPLFPACALLAASYWSEGLKEPSTKGLRGSIHVMMGIGYLVAVGLASAPFLFHKFSGKMVKEFPLATQVDLGIGPYLGAIMVVAAMGFIGYYGLNDTKRHLTFGVAGAALASVFLLAILVVIPDVNRYAIAPPQELAYAAGLNLNPTDQLIAFGITRPSTAFYARRTVLFIPSNELDRLRTALSKEGRTMILLPEYFQEALPREAEGFQPILKRFGYVLLGNEQMVDIPQGTKVVPPTTPSMLLGH